MTVLEVRYEEIKTTFDVTCDYREFASGRPSYFVDGEEVSEDEFRSHLNDEED